MIYTEKLLLKIIVIRRLWCVPWYLLIIWLYLTAWQGGFWQYLKVELREFWEWERSLFFYLLVKSGGGW